MKTLEWHHFFTEQRERHGKVVFSVAELANAARTSLHAVNTELGRLLKSGMVRRYAHGHYGGSGGVSPEDVVSYLDSGAYITGFYALFGHHLVTQAPTLITCFSNRRHNRRSDRVTPVGRFKFISVPEKIYAKPQDEVVAPAEQALCDFVWLGLREGIDPRLLVTFRHIERLKYARLVRILRPYPEDVRHMVGEIIGMRVR